MRKLYTLLMIFFVFGISSFAQKTPVEGTVKTAKNEALPGSTVLIKGTTCRSTH